MWCSMPGLVSLSLNFMNFTECVCYGDIFTGLIKKYWFRYKKIEVILAYLRTVHRVAVG